MVAASITRKKKEGNQHNLRMVILFCVGVGVLVLISLSVKIITLVNQSRFDGEHRFTIVLKDSMTHVISFDPSSKTISALTFLDTISPDRVSSFLEVPVDRVDYLENEKHSLKNMNDVENILKKLLLRLDKKANELTIIDVARLYFFTHSLSPSSVTAVQVSSKQNDAVRDKLSMSLFTDSDIVMEKESIQIVNGTSVSGLGNRLARFITNMGGSVVAVSNSDTPITKTRIDYFGKKTYTLAKLSSILSVKGRETQQSGIADIAIYIGNDMLSNLPF